MGPWYLAGMVVVFIAFYAAIIIFFSRCYVKAPPGQVIVVSGMGGMKATTGAGILAYPVIHRVDFLHAESEIIHFSGEELVVQLRREREAILDGAATFGSKNREQTREILQTLADACGGDREVLTSKLLGVGYEVL